MRMIKVLDKGSCENQTLEGLAIGCASCGVSSCFGKFENPIIHGSELGAPVVPTFKQESLDYTVSESVFKYHPFWNSVNTKRYYLK